MAPTDDMPANLTDRPRRSIVTGGGSGIGLALTELLASSGSDVLAVDVDPSRADAVSTAGGRLAVADVADPAHWERVTDEVTAGMGGLDLLVLNAGVPVLEPDVVTAPLKRVQRAYAVNVDGVIHGVRAAVPLLAVNGGDIVIVASLAGIMAYPDDPYYAMTKHAVVGFGLSAARSLAARNVRVTIFCPGVVDTPLVPDHVRAAVTGAGLELLSARDSASHLLAAVAEGGTGRIWISQAHLGLVEHRPTKVELPRPPVPSGSR